MSKKSPQLRFEGFTDDWEERKLGELLKSAYQGINTAGDKVIYSEKGVEILQSKHITSGYITFDDTRFLDKKRYSEYFPKYVPKKHDILFANIGTIGPSTVVETNKEFLIAWNILKMTPNENVNSKFIELFLQILNEKHYYEKITTGNATKFVNKDAILNIELCTSSFKEQQKIGSFFQQLDNTIALHQRKLDLLKEQKKGYLQKMFPKNGAKVPELRFAGFADDWEERKLGDFSDVRDGTHASPKYISEGHPMVTSKNLTHSGLDMTDVSFLTDEDFDEINKRSKVSIGDILFGMIGTIGNPVIVYRDDFAIKNVALIKEKSSNPIINKWLLQYLKSPSFNRFIQKENAGGTQKFIALGLIRDMNLRVPKKEEQQKIGSFFKHLDDTIALHQRKLDLLKEQKKGFLQKMFV
mgnify:FL=1